MSSQTSKPKQPLKPSATLLGPSPCESARSLIHRTLPDPPQANSRTAEVYGSFSWSKGYKAISSPPCATSCRSHSYANLLGPIADTLCPLYKEEPQAIEHWLRRCPGLDATRQNIFGSPCPPLKVLTTDPERVLALARITLG